MYEICYHSWMERVSNNDISYHTCTKCGDNTYQEEYNKIYESKEEENEK